jgi:hypothetical protein
MRKIGTLSPDFSFPDFTGRSMIRAIILVSSCLVLVGCAGQTQQPKSSPPRDAKPSAHTKTQFPSSDDIAAFMANPPPARTHFKGFIVDQKQIAAVLDTWHRIPQDHWRHGYSHVAMEDRTGSLTLKDGRTVQWMVKPGGLSTLSMPDGETIYLARELTPWKGNAKPEN